MTVSDKNTYNSDSESIKTLQSRGLSEPAALAALKAKEKYTEVAAALVRGTVRGVRLSDLYQQFKERAEAVSAEVLRFATEAEAFAWLACFLRREEVTDAPGRYAVCAAGELPLGETIPGLRYEVTREAAAHAKIGISRMDWAVAATGTLAQDATAVEQRLVSTLPPIHVALLATDRILPDLAALLAAAPPARCGYVSLITGPSRTADIERVLTIGVHGPERLVILCLDQISGAHE